MPLVVEVGPPVRQPAAVPVHEAEVCQEKRIAGELEDPPGPEVGLAEALHELLGLPLPRHLALGRVDREAPLHDFRYQLCTKSRPARP